MDNTLNHDERVKKISAVLKEYEKEAYSIDEWKQHFKSKGYTDDEIDLGYALTDAESIYNPSSSLLTTIVIFIFSLVLAYLAYVRSGENIKSGEEYIQILSTVLAFLTPNALYFKYLKGKLGKIYYSILKNDFQAQYIQKKYFVNLESTLFQHMNSKFHNLLACSYDKRNTFFGNFHYVIAKNYEHDFFVVIQELKKPFPNIHCFRKMKMLPINIAHGLNKVTLEGKFNEEFSVYTQNPTDAFYVLNPRIMDKLLQREVFQDIKIFEVIGNYLLVSFKEQKLYKIRLKPPIVKFEDYIVGKKKVLEFMDIVSDLSDVISRQIIDDGSNRNVAKNM